MECRVGENKSIPIRILRSRPETEPALVNCYLLQVEKGQKDFSNADFSASDDLVLLRLWVDKVFSVEGVPTTRNDFEQLAADLLNNYHASSAEPFSDLHIRGRLHDLFRVHREILGKSFGNRGVEVGLRRQFASFHAVYGYLGCERIVQQTTKALKKRKMCFRAPKEYKDLKLILECPSATSQNIYHVMRVEPIECLSEDDTHLRPFSPSDDVIIVESWYEYNSKYIKTSGLMFEKGVARKLNALAQYENPGNLTWFDARQVHLRLVLLMKTYCNVIDKWTNTKPKPEWVVLTAQEFLNFGCVFRFLGGRQVNMQNRTSIPTVSPLLIMKESSCPSGAIASDGVFASDNDDFQNSNNPQTREVQNPMIIADPSSPASPATGNHSCKNENKGQDEQTTDSATTPQPTSNPSDNPDVQNTGKKRPREKDKLSDSDNSLSSQDNRSSDHDKDMKQQRRRGNEDETGKQSGAIEFKGLDHDSSQNQRHQELEADVRIHALMVQREQLALKRAELCAKTARVVRRAAHEDRMERLKQLKESAEVLGGLAQPEQMTRIVRMIMDQLESFYRL